MHPVGFHCKNTRNRIAAVKVPMSLHFRLCLVEGCSSEWWLRGGMSFTSSSVWWKILVVLERNTETRTCF